MLVHKKIAAAVSRTAICRYNGRNESMKEVFFLKINLPQTYFSKLLRAVVEFDMIADGDKIKASISDLQIFLAIQSCWDNCLTVGSRMKQLYDNNEIAWDDITRFAIVIDEAHRIINTNKRSVVEQILQIQRMARKLFGGVWLASQSIRDFVPEGSSASAADLIRVMFEESPYKLLLRQDNSAAQMISETFGSILSQEDLDDLVKLEMGHCILCFGSERKVQVAINLTADEQEMFKGGA